MGDGLSLEMLCAVRAAAFFYLVLLRSFWFLLLQVKRKTKNCGIGKGSGSSSGGGSGSGLPRSCCLFLAQSLAARSMLQPRCATEALGWAGLDMGHWPGRAGAPPKPCAASRAASISRTIMPTSPPGDQQQRAVLRRVAGVHGDAGGGAGDTPQGWGRGFPFCLFFICFFFSFIFWILSAPAHLALLAPWPSCSLPFAPPLLPGRRGGSGVLCVGDCFALTPWLVGWGW